MNDTVVTEFPPIALYAILSLAVAVLSFVTTFREGAVTAKELFEAWGHLFDTSAYLSLFAWLHVTAYVIWQFVTTSTVRDQFNQWVHFVILVSFGYVFFHIWRFWTGQQTSPQNVMRREGE